MHDLGFLYLVTKQLYNPEILQVNKGSVETSCRMNMAKQGREMCLSLCLGFFCSFIQDHCCDVDRSDADIRLYISIVCLSQVCSSVEKINMKYMYVYFTI